MDAFDDLVGWVGRLTGDVLSKGKKKPAPKKAQGKTGVLKVTTPPKPSKNQLEGKKTGNEGSTQHAPPGFTPIPESQFGGWHKKNGNKWETWYPGKGAGPHPKEKMGDSDHQRAHDNMSEKYRGFLDKLRNTDLRRFEQDKAPKKAASTEPKQPKKPAKPPKPGSKAEAKAKEKAAKDAEKAAKKGDKKPKDDGAGDPHAATREKFKHLDLDRQIDKNATDVQELHDPASGEDPNQGAIMSWKNTKGETVRAYTNEFNRRTAHVKWTRLATLVPKMEKSTAALQSAMQEGSQRDKDAAVSLAIIESTGLRPGSRASAMAKGKNAKGKDAATFGVTTLKPEHIKFVGDTAHIDFIGKSSEKNHRVIDDPTIVAELKSRVDSAPKDGFLFSANEADTRRTMKKYFGQFKTKDLRTLRGSMLAADELAREPAPDITGNKTIDEKAILEVINKVSGKVSEYLNNGSAIARQSYIHPSLFASWLQQHGESGGYIQSLFGKGKKGTHPLRDMTGPGKKLLEGALKRAKSEDAVKGFPAHEGDTDDDYETDSFPVSLEGF